MQEENKEIEQSNNNQSGMKYLAVIPFIVGCALYMSVWSSIETKVEDPWYKAIRKVDSSKSIKDEKARTALFKEGGEELKELAVKYPKHARLHFFLGYYYGQAGEADSAIVEYKKAIEMGKGAVVNQVDQQAMTMISQVVLAKATKELQQQKFEDAITTINKSIMYNPQDPNFYYIKGVCFQNLSRIDSARVMYEITLKFDPNHGGGKENLANLYYMISNEHLKNDRLKEAEPILRQAVALAPNFAPTHFNLGLALLRQNRIKDAIPFLERAAYLNPREEAYKKTLEQAKKAGA